MVIYQKKYPAQFAKDGNDLGFPTNTKQNLNIAISWDTLDKEMCQIIKSREVGTREHDFYSILRIVGDVHQKSHMSS